MLRTAHDKSQWYGGLCLQERSACITYATAGNAFPTLPALSVIQGTTLSFALGGAEYLTFLDSFMSGCCLTALFV